MSFFRNFFSTINEEKKSWQSIWEICQSFTKKPFLGTLPLDYSASILSFMQRTQFVSLHLIFYGTVKCCLVLTNFTIHICTNSTTKIAKTKPEKSSKKLPKRSNWCTFANSKSWRNDPLKTTYKIKSQNHLELSFCNKTQSCLVKN